MYDELVKRLRVAKAVVFKAEDTELLTQAADAIEELSGRDINVPRWIPVTERLPEEYTTILFVSSSGQVHVGYYDSEHKGFCDMTGFRYVCTHWMLAPEPPKEE